MARKELTYATKQLIATEINREKIRKANMRMYKSSGDAASGHESSQTSRIDLILQKANAMKCKSTMNPAKVKRRSTSPPLLPTKSTFRIIENLSISCSGPGIRKRRTKVETLECWTYIGGTLTYIDCRDECGHEDIEPADLVQVQGGIQQLYQAAREDEGFVMRFVGIYVVMMTSCCWLGVVSVSVTVAMEVCVCV